MNRSCVVLTAALAWLVWAAWAGQPAALRFEEAGERMGLRRPLKGMMAHGAACGDVDGDGDLDLYVGAFCDRPAEKYLGAAGPVANVLLINEGGRFRVADQPAAVMKARTSGAVFADLDNDGDLDLYVSNNSKRKGLRAANRLLENVGGGRFRDASASNAACIVMGGRSVGVLDYDGDGLLDLLVAWDNWTGGRTRLFRNKGRLAFEDVTARAHLPEDLPGLGVVTPDLNGDGRPDVLVAQANRLFLSRPDDTFREDVVASKAFQYKPLGCEDTPCGVACGDLDRDGDLDVVIVDHNQPARQHVFENVTAGGGLVRFRDVTKAAGLDYRFPSWTPERRHLKHAHVEIADFDCDGWPDILIAATWRNGDADQPFICRNLGAGGQGLRFDLPPIEKATDYYAAGPVADYDRDGRPDVMFASWWPQVPSSLYLNRTPRRHWLAVRVVGRTINRMGIGAKVRLYAPGRIGRPGALLGSAEIGISQGFCSGQEAVAHLGLGEATTCDVEVILPHGRGTIRQNAIAADRTLVIREP